MRRRPRKRHIHLFASLACVCLQFVSRTGLSADEAALPSDFLVHNVGVWEAGELRSVKVSINNSSPADVQVLRVKTDCACLKVVSAPRIIRARESRQFRFNLTSANGGAFRRIAQIETDSPSRRHITVVFEGIARAISIVPSTLNVGGISGHQPSVRFVSIRAYAVELPSDLSIKSTEPAISAILDPGSSVGARESRLEASEQGRVLAIHIDPTRMNIGDINAEVNIYTNIPGYSVLKVPVVGFVNGDITSVPPTLLFTQLSNTANQTRLCILNVDKSVVDRVELMKLRADHDMVNAKVLRTTSDSNTLRLLVSASCDGEVELPIINGKLVGTIDKRTVLVIPYTLCRDQH